MLFEGDENMDTQQLKILRTKMKELDDQILEAYRVIYDHMDWYCSFDNLDDLFERVEYLKRLANKQKHLSEAIAWIEE